MTSKDRKAAHQFQVVRSLQIFYFGLVQAKACTELEKDKGMSNPCWFERSDTDGITRLNYFSGRNVMGAFVWLIVIGTSIWVYIDAKKIGVKKGQLDGFCDLGPGAWAVVCLLLWIIGFPAYLIKRGEYIKINRGDIIAATTSEPDKEMKASAPPKAETKSVKIESNETQRPHRDASPSSQSSSKELLKKGVGFFKSGNYKEALSVFDQVISLNAKNAEAYFIRGAIYNRLGKKELAIVDLKSAANLGHKKSQDLLVSKGIAS